MESMQAGLCFHDGKFLPNQFRKCDSISYKGFPSKGGKLIGEGNRGAYGTISPEALASSKILENGNELWFSVFIQEHKGFWARFGLKGSKKDSGADLGFMIDRGKLMLTYKGKPSGTNRFRFSHSAGIRFEKKTPYMFIGRCIWSKTDTEPDTVEIYRVYDSPVFGPMVLNKPAAVMQEVIPQKEIDTIFIAGNGSLDEIRIGKTLHSVMIGTKAMSQDN